MTRAEAVAVVADALGRDAAIVACNGMIGRELYSHADGPLRFYMIGSMGLASSIGLGLALVQPARRVSVFDGDGNLLMNLGGLANVAAAAPRNFHHVVFDNAAHGSTGDQQTVSDRVPLEAIAAAAGYRRCRRVSDTIELTELLPAWFDGEGPSMLLIEVARGNVPGIARVERPAAEIAARFRTACTSS
jgi:sulfopyruvate decarboxylase subunit beta